jgi:hypothetical protein
MTISIDPGDVWSHYCTLNQEGEVVDRGRFRTTVKAIEKWFTDLPPARVAMEAGTCVAGKVISASDGTQTGRQPLLDVA